MVGWVFFQYSIYRSPEQCRLFALLTFSIPFNVNNIITKMLGTVLCKLWEHSKLFIIISESRFRNLTPHPSDLWPCQAVSYCSLSSSFFTLGLCLFSPKPNTPPSPFKPFLCIHIVLYSLTTSSIFTRLMCTASTLTFNYLCQSLSLLGAFLHACSK